MNNDNELSIVRSGLFGKINCDFWRDENNDVWMTREQIGQALEYSNPQKAIDNLHERNKERLDQFSVILKLRATDGKLYDTCLYSEKGIYEICRWSRQPKANQFYDFIYDMLEDLRKGNKKLIDIDSISRLDLAKMLLERGTELSPN